MAQTDMRLLDFSGNYVCVTAQSHMLPQQMKFLIIQPLDLMADKEKWPKKETVGLGKFRTS